MDEEQKTKIAEEMLNNPEQLDRLGKSLKEDSEPWPIESEAVAIGGNLTGEDEVCGEPIPSLPSRKELLDYLKSLKVRTDKSHERHIDPAKVHVLADMAMLKYIHHPEIESVFKSLPRWYE